MGRDRVKLVLVLWTACAWGQVPQVVLGAPFSGEEIRTGQTAVKIARDADGRTRVERPGFVDITDPVASESIVLDVAKKIARRTKLQRIPVEPATPGERAVISSNMAGVLITPPPQNGLPEITVEQLGTRTIQGVTVEGRRQTMPGTIADVTETWISPELKMTILQIHKGAGGESTVEIRNLSRQNPALELFQVPEGYTVQEGIPR
ncbi:MAG: hypothetical protein WDO18_22425 [Acidobacteriota bacterium]